MGDSNMAELSKSTTPVTVGMLTDVTDVLLAGIKKLSGRMAELEKAPLVYEGPHEAGKVYDKGQFTTHNGSLWHCNYKTASRPGDGPAWTLAVKRGADGRDAK
ncbi:carbohydrate-binding family V/XII protein [Rhodoferax ferrireducens]|uniref:carbohydrate-binding family V/XII protein n=1 Tax=Rhodoferax ferrireducens TaxID=192843 RepID=UPI003BB7D48C